MKILNSKMTISMASMAVATALSSTQAHADIIDDVLAEVNFISGQVDTVNNNVGVVNNNVGVVNNNVANVATTVTEIKDIVGGLSLDSLNSLPKEVLQLRIINNVDGSHDTNTLEEAIENMWFYGWDTHTKITSLPKEVLQLRIINNVDGSHDSNTLEEAIENMWFYGWDTHTQVTSLPGTITTAVTGVVDTAAAGLSGTMDLGFSAIDTSIGGINAGINGISSGIGTLDTGLTSVGIELADLDDTLIGLGADVQELGLLKNEITLALAAIETTNELIADPSLQTAFGILSDDAGGFISELDKVVEDAERLQTLVYNVNSISSKLPTRVDEELTDILDTAQKLFDFARSQTQLALDTQSQHPDIDTLFTNTQDLMNVLNDGVGPDLNLNALIELVNLMPETVQATFGYALQLGGIDQAFVTKLGQATTDVSELLNVVKAKTNISSDVLSCSDVNAQSDVTEERAIAVITLGVGLKLVGAAATAFGHSGFKLSDEALVGTHGYALVKVKNSTFKQIGGALSGTSDALIVVANQAINKTRDCKIQADQESVHQRFVDVVGGDAWEPGTPLNEAHTLAGIGDGVVEAGSALGVIDSSVTSANVALAIINSEVVAANTTLDVISNGTTNANATLGVIDDGVVATNNTLGVIDDGVATANDALRLIKIRSHQIPEMGKQLVDIKNTVESNSEMLAVLVEQINNATKTTTEGSTQMAYGVLSLEGNTSAQSELSQNSNYVMINAAKGEEAELAKSDNAVINSEVTVDYQKLLLRFRIEESLMNADKPKGIALFYRPTEFGGQLEFVRKIVNETIQQNINNGYSVGEALSYLDEGDAQFSNGYYKEAWEAFAHAYREAL